jgi:hypothetical protein
MNLVKQFAQLGTFAELSLWKGLEISPLLKRSLLPEAGILIEKFVTNRQIWTSDRQQQFLNFLNSTIDPLWRTIE